MASKKNSALPILYRTLRKHSQRIERRILASWNDEFALSSTTSDHVPLTNRFFEPLIERVKSFPEGVSLLSLPQLPHPPVLLSHTYMLCVIHTTTTTTTIFVLQVLR